MYRRFVQFIKENDLFRENEKLVVGVSGGADSVCLLYLLCKLREEMPFDMTVVHIHHGVRKEATEDAKFVQDVCHKMKVNFVIRKFEVEKLKKEWNMSTEEAGRKVRYDTFAEILGNDKGKIVVAHNQNDVAETVLFNLFRGSGAKGLTGIRPKNGNIVRPLLCFSRGEIESFLSENKLTFCIDKTNLTDDYTRNKIRNHIIPYVEENIVKGSVEHIYHTAGLLDEQEDFLLKEAEKVLCEVSKTDETKGISKINSRKFLELHGFLQKKIIYLLLEKLSGSKKDIGLKHVEQVLSLFEKEGMKFVSLPYNLQAKSVYDEVIIERLTVPEKEEVTSCELKEAKGFTFRIISDKMPDTIPEKTYTKWFDYDKIVGTAVVRTRQEGDFLMMQNGQHKKSLKRYFIDEKIPKDMRDKILLLADGSHILWVIGMRISDYYKVTGDTKRIIEIQYDGG